MADFSLANHGSVMILAPLTDAGRDWIDENLPDDVMWFANGVAIEPRYIEPIMDGIAGDGLEIEDS